VNPAPVVALNGLASTYCLNSDVVTLAGTPALGTYSGPGVTGGTFDPAAAGVGTHTIRYEFDNGTCVGFDEVTVTVTDNLTLTFSVPASVCSDADPFLLTSSPEGAVFSGPGVNGQTFSPQVAGVGTHTITATYSNGTCSATATQTITVNPAPVASFNYSANGSTVVFSNASVNATSYSWDFGDGQTTTATNPSHTYGANGSYDITLIASSNGCGADTFTVELELSVGIGSIDGVDMIQLFFQDQRLFLDPLLE
jgi:PKD repeat protein